MSKNLSGISLVAVMAMVAAACSGGSEEAAVTTAAPETTTATTEATETTTAVTEPPSTEAATTTTVVPDVPRQPLTGEPIDSEADIIDRAALAVKIDNHPRARANHTGLALADIVFEEKVEGSLTRFAAVFHSQGADPIGPIRSGREQDVGILSSLNEPLFGWSGGNPGVTRLVRFSLLVDIGAPTNSGSYYRGDGGSPHNLYSDSDSLYALTPDEHPGPPDLQFAYLDADTVFEGEPGRDVSLEIGSIDIDWNWNDDENRYERSQEGDEHVDKTFGRIGAQNVVLLGVDYRSGTIDANAPEAVVLGEGVATVFSNGEYVTGTWSKEFDFAPFTLLLDSGEALELTPGQTWVELVEVDTAGDAPEFTLDS